MVMPVIFGVEDGQILAERLKATGKAAGRIARKALKAGGQPMLTAIRGRVRRNTGLLSEGLRLRFGRGDHRGKYSVLISSRTTRARFARKKKFYRIAAGQPSDRYAIYYGLMVEYGHRQRPGGRTGSDGFVRAYPFARPGFDATVGQTAELIEQLVADGITDAF